MSQLPTAEQVTNLYLYSQTNTPSDMTSEALIRASTTEPTKKEIDIATYMAGPGRFASASRFEIVEKFLNPSLFAASYNIPANTPVKPYYTKDELYGFFGISDILRRLVKVDQAQYDDGKDDFLERAYIWNTTAFQIQDGAKFVVEANGNRYIDDFAVVPYSNSTNPENFDFAAGSPFGKYIVNPVLEPKVDPSKIGIRVNFDFISPLAGSRFTYLDYVTASTTAKTANPALYAVIAVQGTAFLDRLWQSGSTRFIDPEGRAIFYGSDKQDTLSVARFAFTGIDSNLRNAMDAKGVRLIGGSGGDSLTGDIRSDYLDGGTGDDRLTGGAGADILMGGTGDDLYIWNAGDGNDTIIDSDGGRLRIKGVDYIFGGGVMVKQGGSNIWQDPSGNVTITHNSPWRIELSDGSVIQLGEDFDPVKWHIDLEDVALTQAIFNGDQRAPINGSGNYDWAATSWAADGTLTGGVAEANFPDVISAAAAGTNGSVIHGYGGADALSGSSGKDDIYGDDGNDIIGGGAGSDNIRGGAGNDFIVSAETLNIAQRLKPADSWSAPVGATVLAQGSNWGAYTLGGIVYWNRPNPIAVDDAPDVVDAGAGDDVVYGGRGDDYIQGGLGLDSLNGGGGNDIIDGGDDADRIAGDDIAANGLAPELNGKDVSENTPYLVADYAYKSRSVARFDAENRLYSAQKQQFQRRIRCSSAQTSYAYTVRLAGHKGLGRRMDSARAAKHLPILDGLLNDLHENNSCHS